jgi:arylformamidase
MRHRPLIAAIALVSLVASGASSAVARTAAAQNTPGRTGAETATASRQTLAYGPGPLQQLDYWATSRATTPAGAPLVVFIHGGGWKRGDKQMMDGSAKLRHWQALGYAVASVNYRLVPDVRVEDQAADIAAALALLKARAPMLGFDPARIALVGHSAGAHLAALVGTDPAYLAAAGLSPGDIRGIVPLDGAAYDVPRQIKDGGRIMRGTYLQAFGDDPARQRALSPVFHAAAPNAPEFLILHVEREDGTAQSEALARALRQAGTPAMLQGFAGKGLRGHARINRELGEADYPATPMVAAFLARIFE